MIQKYILAASEKDIAAAAAAIVKDVTIPDISEIEPGNNAPIVIKDGNSRAIADASWGMPLPTHFAAPPVTLIRNVTSPYWRQWLGSRCLVPWTRYCEIINDPPFAAKPRKLPVWYAPRRPDPLPFFAALFRDHAGEIPPAPNARSFGLVMDRNVKDLAPARTPPLVLANEQDVKTWIEGSDDEALQLIQSSKGQASLDRCA